MYTVCLYDQVGGQVLTKLLNKVQQEYINIILVIYDNILYNIIIPFIIILNIILYALSTDKFYVSRNVRR